MVLPTSFPRVLPGRARSYGCTARQPAGPVRWRPDLKATMCVCGITPYDIRIWAMLSPIATFDLIHRLAAGSRS